ncbi:MAG: hypothetical protein AAFN13_15745 [Bacteroidota bacterium]
MRVLLVAFALLLAACDQSGTPPGAPGGQPPVVTEIDVRTEFNAGLGTLVVASQGAACSPFLPSRLTPERPARAAQLYPNPAVGSFAVDFQVDQTSRVRVFAVPAVGPGACTPPRLSASAITAPYGGLAAFLLADQTLPSGRHVVTGGFTGDFPEATPWPAGFYRVYVESASRLDFVDLLVVDPLRPPPGACQYLALSC